MFVGKRAIDVWQEDMHSGRLILLPYVRRLLCWQAVRVHIAGQLEQRVTEKEQTGVYKIEGLCWVTPKREVIYRHGSSREKATEETTTWSNWGAIAAAKCETMQALWRISPIALLLHENGRK